MATVTLAAYGDINSGNSGGITSFVTSSISPGANCALVLFFGAGGRPFTGEPFDGATAESSGSGPSWTPRADTALGTDSRGCTIHTATVGGSDPGWFTVTWTGPGGEIAGGWYAIVKVTGHDTSTTFAGAVVAGNQADGTGSVTLGATPVSGDAVLAMAATGGSNVGAAFDTGWTELQDFVGGAMPWEAPSGGNVGYRTDTTSTTVSWSDLSSGGTTDSAALMAIIVKNASAASTSAPPRRRRLAIRYR